MAELLAIPTVPFQHYTHYNPEEPFYPPIHAYMARPRSEQVEIISNGGVSGSPEEGTMAPVTKGAAAENLSTVVSTGGKKTRNGSNAIGTDKGKNKGTIR